MRIAALRLFILLLSVVCLGSTTPTITLYPPHQPVTQKYDEGKACFSFKRGLLKEITGKEWDLGYGFLSISEQDWFVLHSSRENRSVIRDLGEWNWDDHLTIPVLEPLPVLQPGKQREISIDSSADTHKEWTRTTSIFAKVALGHMYVLHLKDDDTDLYVMFRVEDFEQHKHCTISWRYVPAPKAPGN